jgi:hypothetical protein
MYRFNTKQRGASPVRKAGAAAQLRRDSNTNTAQKAGAVSRRRKNTSRNPNRGGANSTGQTGDAAKANALKSVDAHVEVVRAPNYLRLEGDAMNLSAEILEQLKWVVWNFRRELPHIQIIKIQYVMNETLYNLFEQTRREYRQQGKSTKEMLLFHGTKPENVDK